MKKILFFVVLAMGFGACRKAEIPLYDEQVQAINFWAPPVPGVIVTYPDALELSYTAYDPGSTELKLLAFAPDFPVKAGVEIMGVAQATDRAVRLKVNEEFSDERIEVLLGDYRIAAGEGTALLPLVFDVTGLPVGEQGNIALEFDYDAMDFAPGAVQRKSYTIEFTKKAGTPMPNDPAGFGFPFFLPPEMAWDGDFYGYGAYSLIKLQFIAAVTGKITLYDFETLVPSWQGGSPAPFATALEEYKALNAEDPVNYPPLYHSDETWISFP